MLRFLVILFVLFASFSEVQAWRAGLSAAYNSLPEMFNRPSPLSALPKSSWQFSELDTEDLDAPEEKSADSLWDEETSFRSWARLVEWGMEEWDAEAFDEDEDVGAVPEDEDVSAVPEEEEEELLVLGEDEDDNGRPSFWGMLPMALGKTAWISLTYPSERLVQAANLEGLSFLKACRTIYVKQGWRGFYHGVQAVTLREIPKNIGQYYAIWAGGMLARMTYDEDTLEKYPSLRYSFTSPMLGLYNGLSLTVPQTAQIRMSEEGPFKKWFEGRGSGRSSMPTLRDYWKFQELQFLKKPKGHYQLIRSHFRGLWPNVIEGTVGWQLYLWPNYVMCRWARQQTEDGSISPLHFAGIAAVNSGVDTINFLYYQYIRNQVQSANNPAGRTSWDVFKHMNKQILRDPRFIAQIYRSLPAGALRGLFFVWYDMMMELSSI